MRLSRALTALATALLLTPVCALPAQAADGLPPVITIDPEPAPDWLNDWATLHVQAADAESGVESLGYRLTGATEDHGDLPPLDGGDVTVTGEGLTHLEVTATDREGNTAILDREVRLDLTNPLIDVTGVAGGDDFTIGQQVAVELRCTDELSGIQSCTAPALVDGFLNTSRIGNRVLSVTAVDNAGRRVVRDIGYHVSGTFSLGERPKVDGTPRTDQVLTGTPPTVTPDAHTTACAWIRDADEEVGDATTYRLTPADVGHHLSFRCTALRPEYVPLESSSIAVEALPGVIADGAVVGRALRGSGRLGSTLSAAYTVTDPAVDAEVRWSRDGKVLPGASGATYAVTAADRGHDISATVWAHRSGYAERAFSLGTVGVERVLVADGAPRVSGVPRVGTRLSVVRPAVHAAVGDRSPVTTTVTWLRDGRPIGGATGVSYVLARADAGHRISARVVATSPGYPALTSTTPRGAVVAKAAPVLRLMLAAGGHGRVRVTLTAKAGELRPSGRVLVRRDGKVVARAELRSGRLVLTLNKQKAGRAAYAASYAGEQGVNAAHLSRTVRVR